MGITKKKKKRAKINNDDPTLQGSIFRFPKLHLEAVEYCQRSVPWYCVPCSRQTVL